MNISKKLKIWLLILLVILTGVLFLLNGCALDAGFKATAFDGTIDETSQIALTSGRPARD